MDEVAHIPIEYLNRIADHCPRAMATYLMCCREANDDLEAFMSKRWIVFDQNASYTCTINDLRALGKEGLLSFSATVEGIFVTLASYGHE